MAYGNHYSRQVQQLEAVVSSKLQQLSLLQHENQLLHNEEAALQDAIDGIAGPLSLVKEVLAEAAAGAAPGAAPGQQHSLLATPSTSHGCSSAQQCSPANSGEGSGSVAIDRSGGSFSSRLPASASYKDTPALLQHLESCEARVHKALQQLGCCDSAGYKQLYTTQLLRRAVSHPAVMAGYLNMPKAERLRYWANAHTQMALLLSKYDSNVNLKTGNVREQLDRITDELFERVTVCALLDPPQKYMSCFMFNVETHEFEPYPQGWWSQVVQGIALTPEQTAAIKLVWGRIKGTVQRLTKVFLHLQQKLQQVHIQELQNNRQFEQEMQQLPSMQRTLVAAESLQQELKKQLLLRALRLTSDPAIGAAAPLCVGLQPSSLRPSVTTGEQFLAMLAEEMSQELKQEADQMQSWASAAAAAPKLTTVLPASASSSALQGADSTAAAPGSASAASAATAAATAGRTPSPGLTTPGLSAAGAAGLKAESAEAAAAPAVSATPQPASAHAVSASDACVASGTLCGPLDEAEEVLLQAGSKERQFLERTLAALQNRVEVLSYCLCLQLTNILTKKQLAAMCVHAHPFFVDAISMCEGLDELEIEL